VSIQEHSDKNHEARLQQDRNMTGRENRSAIRSEADKRT
jgi:hypothetical protein